MENLFSGFNEYRMLILNELERDDQRLSHIEETLVIIQKEIVKLQMKSGVWGALMGLIAAATAFFFANT